jgi:hypothetical protein
MSNARVVVGVYTYLDDILSAISSIKSKGNKVYTYAPTYVAELEKAVDKKRSPVSRLTLVGALTGVTFGFSLAILTGLDWPLRVSAKNIVAIPGYFVVGYECNILFGAIATLLGTLHFSRLPNIFRNPGYDPRFSLDKFGLVVECTDEQVSEIKSLLDKSGADEVSEQDAL